MHRSLSFLNPSDLRTIHFIRLSSMDEDKPECNLKSDKKRKIPAKPRIIPKTAMECFQIGRECPELAACNKNLQLHEIISLYGEKWEVPWTATGKRLELLEKIIPKPDYSAWIDAYKNVEELPEFEDSWKTSEYGRMWTLFLVTIHKNFFKIGNGQFISGVAFKPLCEGEDMKYWVGLKKNVIPSSTNKLRIQSTYTIKYIEVGEGKRYVVAESFHAKNTYMYELPFRTIEKDEGKQKMEFVASGNRLDLSFDKLKKLDYEFADAGEDSNATIVFKNDFKTLYEDQEEMSIGGALYVQSTKLIRPGDFVTLNYNKVFTYLDTTDTQYSGDKVTASNQQSLIGWLVDRFI